MASDTFVSLFSTCLPSHPEGVKLHLGGRRWMLCTNGPIVGRAATDATSDDAWENLVQIIQETAGPNFQQGAPRPTRPLALERRRLLLELGTARRLTGSSGDQSLVDKAKTEITRVEKQMRRFSRWLLRRRRATWLGELEEGIRKQDAFTVYRYARLLAGTGIGWKHRRFGQIRAYTPCQIDWAQGLEKEGQREVLLYTNTLGPTSDESIWSFWTLLKAKRSRLIGKRLEPPTIAH